MKIHVITNTLSFLFPWNTKGDFFEQCSGQRGFQVLKRTIKVVHMTHALYLKRSSLKNDVV